MMNFDCITKEKVKIHNPNWPEIPDHAYKIIIIITGGSGSGKTYALLNLVSPQPDIDKTYLYAKDPYEPKDPLLVSKCEGVDLKGI